MGREVPRSAWDCARNLSLIRISKMLLNKLGKDDNARKHLRLLTLDFDRQTFSQGRTS